MGFVGHGLPSPLLDSEALEGRNQEYLVLPRIPNTFPLQSIYIANKISTVEWRLQSLISLSLRCVWGGDAPEDTS